MRTPYPRGEETKLAPIALRRRAAAASYKVGSGIAWIGLACTVLAYPLRSPPMFDLGAIILLPTLAWRYGQQKTLLDLKGLSWSDCPLRRRVIFFLACYETAPDETDHASDTSFSEPPPRKGG